MIKDWTQWIMDISVSLQKESGKQLISASGFMENVHKFCILFLNNTG